MNRSLSLLAPAVLLGLAGCILNFDGLTGGKGSGGAGGSGSGSGGGIGGGIGGGGGGGSGGGTSCPGCGLCQGVCSEGKCDAILNMTAGATAFRVAIHNGVLFASDPAEPAIHRFTEGEQPTVFEVPNAPQAIAVDDNFIFWGTESDGMFRCKKADCSKLVELLPAGSDTAPRQMIADEGSLYWITGPDLAAGKVLRCSVTACAPEVIAMDLYRPHSIALDETYVYWTVHGMDGNLDGSIMRARKDGSDLVTYLGNLDGPSGLTVAGGYLYFTNGVYAGKVLRCPLGASACGAIQEITPLATLPDMPVRMPMSVAVLGEWAFWTNDADFTVMACPTAGCATTSDGLPVIVASGLMSPGGLTATSGCAFWTAGSGVFGAEKP
jgi:ferredoxin